MSTPEEAEIVRKSKKHSRIRSFNRLLSVMNHQRILVMAIAVAQTVLKKKKKKVFFNTKKIQFLLNLAGIITFYIVFGVFGIDTC